jgi:hypothetical protein
LELGSNLYQDGNGAKNHNYQNLNIKTILSNKEMQKKKVTIKSNAKQSNAIKKKL